jgi:hypothetical protein
MEKTEVQSVTDTEMTAVLNAPSIFSNKFYITIGPGGVRISFAETHPQVEAPQVRASVTLPHADAFALRDILSELLEHNVRVVEVGEAALAQEMKQSKPATGKKNG